MKRLITLFLLLPAFASAQNFLVTSGTATISFPGDSATFNVAGSDFSASGTMSFTGDRGPGLLTSPVLPGPHQIFPLVGQYGDNMEIALTVNGVPWGVPPDPNLSGGSALFGIGGSAVITGVGTFSGPASFEGGFQGLPQASIPPGNNLNCGLLHCVSLGFEGAGILTLDVVPYPELSGAFKVEQETFTFKSVPEPTTLSLFAFGVAGVGLIRRRKAIAPIRTRHA
jgi:PEP-CTERM motif